jgi:DNA-binding NarL/FixJ family response regulator
MKKCALERLYNFVYAGNLTIGKEFKKMLVSYKECPVDERKHPVIKIAMIDDQIIVRTGLKTLLQEQDDFEVMVECSSSDEAMNRYEALLVCDIVILDISMPQMSGLDLLKELGKRAFPIPVLVLSVYPDRVYGKKVKELGAQGYLTKDCSVQELVDEVVRIVERGTKDEKISGEDTSLGSQDVYSGFLEMLSDREREVFRLLSYGSTIKEIAYELGISIKSVTTYKSRLMEKLEVESLHDILRIGMTINW